MQNILIRARLLAITGAMPATLVMLLLALAPHWIDAGLGLAQPRDDRTPTEGAMA